MYPTVGYTHDVFGADSADQQGIRDKRAMTAPRHSFRTHQDDSLLVRQADQIFDTRCKLGRLHVIGKTPKRGISPTHIGRIMIRMTQAAE